MLVAIVGFLALVVAAQVMSGGESSTWDDQQASAAQDGDEASEMAFVRREADDPMAIGDVDAPVVLAEWVDMRCPFCALFSRDTLPTLIEEYVETGKVRIEFHDVAFYGKQSEDAAIAARAAGKQDKYVDFLAAVYDEAPEGGHPDLPRETLIDFAKKAGVPDIKQFTADLDDPQLRADLQASTQSAQQLGVTSVPFFAAGSSPMSGAQPVAEFREFLDRALAQAE